MLSGYRLGVDYLPGHLSPCSCMLLMQDPDRSPLEAVETMGPSQLLVTGLKVCRVKMLKFVANVFSSLMVTFSYHVPTCVTFFLRMLSKIWLGTSAYF